MNRRGRMSETRAVVRTFAVWFSLSALSVSLRAEIAITNIQNGETIRYPVALLRGAADGHGSVYARNVDNPRTDGANAAPIVDGRFVVLVELAAGQNRLLLTSPLGSLRFTLTYKPMTTKRRVNVVYLTAEDGETGYLTQFDKDRQNYAEKLGTASKLLQTVTAECMYDAGHGRLTFELDFDERGAVRVHTIKYPLAASELRKKDGGQLWKMIHRYLAGHFPYGQNKCLVVMAFTQLDPKTRRVTAHTAVGGGGLALFGSGSMCSWPDGIRDVHRVFTDPTPIDGRKVHDDSNGRSTVWGMASTTIGAMLHELGHTFGLPHVSDRRGVMSRGFDYLNRVVTVVEPPRRGGRELRRFEADEMMRWSRSSAEKLVTNPWFQPDGALIQVPSGVQRVVEVGWKSSWSPDGRCLVFSRSPGSGLHVLELENGKVTRLTDSGKDPAWSPGGRWIAYVSGDALAEEVWCVQVNGEGRRKAVDGGFPHWSGDGSTLYVHSRKRNQVLALRWDVPGAKPTVVYERPPSWYPVVSPNGDRIAYGVREQLQVIDRKTGETIATWPTPRCRSLLLAWSPDGSRIAFGGFGGEDFGLWLLELKDRMGRQLLEGDFTMPAWSPDGTKLSCDARGLSQGGVWLLETEALRIRESKPSTKNP